MPLRSVWVDTSHHITSRCRPRRQLTSSPVTPLQQPIASVSDPPFPPTCSQEVDSADALYCFEVFSANRRSYMLQAEGPDELKAWVSCIRRTIESQVGSGSRGRSDGPDETNASRASHRPPTVEHRPTIEGGGPWVETFEPR